MKARIVLSLVIGALGLGLTLFSGTARSAPILDFGLVAPTSGSISYAGGAAPLVGTNIQVDNVVGLDTVLNQDAVRNCISCVLNFTTGASTGDWAWGGGVTSSITIVGGLDLNNDGDLDDAGDIPTGSTLLTGEFGSAKVISFFGDFKITGSSFSDEKNETLLDFYGLAATNYLGNFNISFSASATSPSAFASALVLSGDVANTPVSAVPEPTPLLLLGSGLIALGFLGRRRGAKARKS